MALSCAPQPFFDNNERSAPEIGAPTYGPFTIANMILIEAKNCVTISRQTTSIVLCSFRSKSLSQNSQVTQSEATHPYLQGPSCLIQYRLDPLVGIFRLGFAFSPATSKHGRDSTSQRPLQHGLVPAKGSAPFWRTSVIALEINYSSRFQTVRFSFNSQRPRI